MGWVDNHFTSEEINADLRTQKDNCSVFMGEIPSGIFKIFRTKRVNILKGISKENIK